MRRCQLAWLLLPALLGVAGPASAQPQEELSGWRFFATVRGNEKDGGMHFNEKYSVLTLPPDVLGKAQPELGDLRLVDGTGRRIPYARRVRRTKQEVRTLNAALFDQGLNAAQGFAQVSLRLEQNDRPDHNEIEVVSAGQNYRRRVVVSASNQENFPPADTHEVLDRFLVQFDSDAGPVLVRKLKYPVQRARFLRVRVYPDPATEKTIPKIENVFVRETQAAVVGVEKTNPAGLDERQPVPADGGPGSAWYIQLNEDPVPVERLTFAVNGTAVNRPMRLEVADLNAPTYTLTGNQWQWRKDGEQLFLEMNFAEVRAGRLRLVVTDFANPPLDLRGATYSAAARQIIFAPPAGKKLEAPLKLYFGNPTVSPAEYDFEKNLPEKLTPEPVAVALEGRQDNPAYVPPPQSLGERLPWLIYVVLSAACAVLVVLLGLLVRQSMRRQDATRASA